MQAFQGCADVKAHYVAQLRAHRRAHTLRQNVWWDGRHGCAVGCTVQSDQLGFYEVLLGIPFDLAWLQVCLFDTLPRPFAYDWSVVFLEAVPIGADLRDVGLDIAAWMARRWGMPPTVSLHDEDRYLMIQDVYEHA